MQSDTRRDGKHGKRSHRNQHGCRGSGILTFRLSWEQEESVKSLKILICLMVFNATFNKISVISWRSVLLVEETG